MSPTIISTIAASILLYLATFAVAMGGLGLVSRELAGGFGVKFNGRMSYFALLTLGAAGLLPATLLLNPDPLWLAVGTAVTFLLSLLLWKFLRVGPGWVFELVLLAKRPARPFWKVERIRSSSGRTRTRRRWVTRDQGEVENAMKVGGFWAVACTGIVLWTVNRTFEITRFSGEYVFGAICLLLVLFAIFAGGAIQQPVISEE